MGKKKIRVFVNLVVDLETELPVREAIKEFGSKGVSKFECTENISISKIEWRSTEGITSCEISADGTHSILKPIKEKDERY